MAFRGTKYPDVIQDNQGNLIKVDRDTVARLRNSGQLLSYDYNAPSGGGGGGMSSSDPYEAPGQQSMSPNPAPLMASPSSPTPKSWNDYKVPSYGGMQNADGTESVGETPNMSVAPRPDTSGRISINGSRPGQQQGPAMQENGLPEGLILQRTPATRGGWTHDSRSVSGIDPGKQAELEDVAVQAYKAKAQAAQETAGAQAAASSAEKEFFGRKAAEENRDKLDIQDQMQARSTWARDQLDKLSQTIDTAAKEQPKIGMFGDGTPSNIVGGLIGMIGIGLAQYASGMTGARNVASDMMNSAIQERIKSQRDSIRARIESAMKGKDDTNRALLVGNETDNALISAVVHREYANALGAIQANKDLAAAHPMAKQLEAQALDQLSKDLLPIAGSVQMQSKDRYVPGHAAGVRVSVNPVLKAMGDVADIQKKLAEADKTAPPGQSAVYGGGGQVSGYLNTPAANEINKESIASIKLSKMLDKIAYYQRRGTPLSPNERADLERLNVLGTLKLAQSLSFRVGTEKDFENASSALGSGDWDWLLTRNAFKAEKMKQDVYQGVKTAYDYYGFDGSKILDEISNTEQPSE